MRVCEGLLNSLLDLAPGVLNSAGLEWGLKIPIFIKFPSSAAAGHGTSPAGPLKP